MQNYLGELRIKAIRENLRTISYFVQGIAERLQLSEDTVFELELAVEEATTNIVSHAYHEGDEGDIHLSAELIGNTLRITLVDWGIPYDPAKVKPFDINEPVEARIQGGMGVHFINKLMDGVEREIPARPGDPNRLTLIKQVQQAKVKRTRKRDTQEFYAMRTVTEGMAAGIKLDELLMLIINKLVDTIDADRGTLYLIDEESGELWSKVLLEEAEVLPEIRVKIGHGVAGQVAATGKSLNIEDAHADPLFNPTFDQQTGYHTQTILAVPMQNPQHKIIGVVQLLNKVGGPFTQRDERLLSAMAAQAAISIENARLYAQELQQELIKRDLQTAHNIQQSFLPEHIPPLHGWDVDTFWMPVQSVAGDFYDLYPLEDGRLAIIIADVSGKGIPAALFMALTVTVLRFGMSLQFSPVEVISRANKLIISNQRSRMFATVFLGYLHPTTGEMVYASAGHNPPILYRGASQRCETITAAGVAVGVFQGAAFVEERVTLEVGDILVLYTDGITEIINRHEDEYGEERLQALIEQNAHLSANSLTHLIVGSIKDFAAGEGSVDDETLIVIKRTGAE